LSIIDYIEISFIKGIGNRKIKQIYETFGTISLPLKEPEILKENFGENLYKLIKNRSGNLRKKAEEEYKKAESIGAYIVTLEDDKYPSLLKEIPDPPPYLYIKGQFPVKGECLSVVGSRKFSGYGKVITGKVVDTLVENQITVVSGLASGIDSIAHFRCLERGGFTVAVLGNGIDLIFPYENRKLYSLIEEKGCLISEFPIGTKANRFTFPQRNRIIAGLSYGTIITEAGKRSGALITARYSNDYGRVVFSIPTNINNPYGEGSNLLLKEGAIPLIDPVDIFEHLPYLKGKSQINNPSQHLTSTEKNIMNLLSTPISLDLLAEKTEISINELLIILFNMEMKGLIYTQNGIVYRE